MYLYPMYYYNLYMSGNPRERNFPALTEARKFIVSRLLPSRRDIINYSFSGLFFTTPPHLQDYEERFYPGQKWVCTEGEVDVSDDPFFDLEWLDPYVIMSSERWRKQPQSKMFWKLFKYISGVNVVRACSNIVLLLFASVYSFCLPVAFC